MAFSQCTQSVNYTGWTHYGDNSAAWSYTSTWARSTMNTNFPTFYVGPDTFINIKFSGDIIVDTAFDDDYIGFVMGYQGPYTLSAPWDMDFVVFDWKKSWQNYQGWITDAGQSLNIVDGTYWQTNASIFPGFWEHNNSASWQVLASNWGNGNGWTNFVTYSFDIIYTPTRVQVFIDDSLYFDVTDCFKPGRIGFYNYSQAGARYSNFTYELYMDYSIASKNVCLGDTAQFTLFDTACATGNSLTNIDTFYWDLGDGTITNDTNPWHIYQTADTFLVSLIAMDINGCTDTSTKEIYIHPEPTAAIYADDVCLGDSLQLFDTSSVPMGEVVDWQWAMGDGNGTDTLEDPWYTYLNAGTFTSQLIIETNAGCVDTATRDINVLPGPYVDFEFENVCFGELLTMHETAIQATSGLSGFYWDVQNNDTVDYTGQQASHLYPENGTYAIELKVTDSAGCRDSIVKTASIHPIPEADFEAPGICFNVPTQFIDSTDINYGSITNWHWDFGDGSDTAYSASNPPQPGPQHLYASPGVKSVTLTVTSDSGCVDVITKQIEVYQLPVADFTNDTVCDDLATTFSQNATSQSGILNYFKWDYGDGDTAVGSGVQHDYASPGLYKVILTVETNLGCQDTVQKNVRVYPEPVTGFGWLNNVCEGEVLKFKDQSTIAQITPGGDEIVAWKWVFNDEDSIFAQDPDYETNVAQSIVVSLTTTSNYGCSTTLTNTATVFPIPVANFEADVACADDTTVLTSTSFVENGLIESVHWRFGNGLSSDTLSGKTVYPTPGSYEVVLTVTSNKSCKDSVRKNITIPETPVVKFTVSPIQGCSPLAVKTTNLSTINDGSLNYEWYVDDSLVSYEEEPTLTIINDTLIPTFHMVKLIAKSELGCPNTFQRVEPIAVLPAPIAGFGLSDDMVNPFEPTLKFINTSEYGVKWHWNFDDESTSSAFAPEHYFKASGSYDVEQVVWNSYECPDTLIKLIEIDPITTLYVPNAFTPNGDDINETWSVKGFNESRDFEITVFNRWGNEMFKGDSMHHEWDGKMPNSDKRAPGGVYVYIITYTTSEGHERTVRGTFSLIR